MKNFSFTNKAYDLLQNLKEDGIIKYSKELPMLNDKIQSSYFSDMHDLRLIIDVVKNTYPLFANADNETILNFIKDTTGIKPIDWQINEANHIDSRYRDIKINEIKPGFSCRLKGSYVTGLGEILPYYYNYTFPTKFLNILEYNRDFMKIWKNSPMVINKFKFIVGDFVSHKDDPNSKGKIKGRLSATKPFPQSKPWIYIPNQYSISWENEGTNDKVPLYHWFDEKVLILNQTPLEALPMKTLHEQTTNTIRKRGKPYIKTKAIFTQEKYEADKIENGYTSDDEAEKAHAGWVDHTTIYTGSNRKSSTERKFLRNKAKQKRKARHQYNLQQYKQRPEKYIEMVSDPNKPGKTSAITNRLICIKTASAEDVVFRVRKNKADKLINAKNSKYSYATKQEWRIYLKTKELLREKNFPKKQKLTQIGGVEGEGIARSQRHKNQKIRRHSRLIKEQKVIKIIPEEKIMYSSRRPTLKVYDENDKLLKDKVHFITKFTRPAYTVFKRILTSVQPHKEIKITSEIIEQRKLQSLKDNIKYLKNKDYKCLDVLKKEFESIERRNDKFMLIEKWSKSFISIYKTVISTLSKSVKVAVIVDILKDNNLLWSDNKIYDFIRYLKLTTHGIFTGKKIKPKRTKFEYTKGMKRNKFRQEFIGRNVIPGKKRCKVKNSIKPVEFETIKSVTRIDYSKLKEQLPNQDKLVHINIKESNENIVEKVAIFKEGVFNTVTGEYLCRPKDVVSWKYEKDKNFKDIIIDKGGGIKKVGIKFRRKNNEELKTYFARQKAKKYDKQKQNQKTQKIVEKPWKMEKKKSKKTRLTTKPFKAVYISYQEAKEYASIRKNKKAYNRLKKTTKLTL